MSDPAALLAFFTERLNDAETAANQAQAWDKQSEQNVPESEMRDYIGFALRRERNYDQPWWAASMQHQLDRRRLPGNPVAALRDVAADRELIEQYRGAAPAPGGNWFGEDNGDYDSGVEAGLLLAVKIRASRFRDVPGYLAEWAPE